jgi:hypothetical protein
VTEHEKRRSVLYMRRWRRDPANREREAARRRSGYWERKLRSALAPEPPDRTSCHFCQFRAVTTVDRLVPLDGDFVPMQVPYCGQC